MSCWVPWPTRMQPLVCSGLLPLWNKIYDLLGRELSEVPVGVMYIRNKKLYITK